MKPIKLKNVNPFSYSMREALRTLKTNIKFSGDDIKVIMLTSTAPNEGKSSVSINLARSLTESGNNVLVVDTDMRKSVLISRLQAETENNEEIYGLSHYLSGQQALDDCIYYTDTKRMCIMFAGPSVPNPTELLEKKYMEKLIEDARSKFDYVLVDTAPLGVAIDAAIVANHCDASILVIAQGGESSKAILETKNQLEAAGSKIMGVIINKVNNGQGRYGYGYGKYGYGKYGKYYANRSEANEEKNTSGEDKKAKKAAKAAEKEAKKKQKAAAKKTSENK